ncbi:hypothetical protein SpCBS45565_g02624 [Spizellomyces sp. 'palustris']|nr:hypothetical protein SpCBS45565_g02624 [Spizellomyces sp. 'palustris']
MSVPQRHHHGPHPAPINTRPSPSHSVSIPSSTPLPSSVTNPSPPRSVAPNSQTPSSAHSKPADAPTSATIASFGDSSTKSGGGEDLVDEELYPTENFNMVTKGVYRSAFPKKKNFSFLKKLGLKSILTLILEEYPDQNKKFMEENKINLFQFGVAGNKEPFVDIPEDTICAALSTDEIIHVRVAPWDASVVERHARSFAHIVFPLLLYTCVVITVLIHCNKGKAASANCNTGPILPYLMNIVGFHIRSPDQWINSLLSYLMQPESLLTQNGSPTGLRLREWRLVRGHQQTIKSQAPPGDGYVQHVSEVQYNNN